MTLRNSTQTYASNLHIHSHLNMLNAIWRMYSLCYLTVERGELPVEVIGLRATLSCIVRTDHHFPGTVVT